MDWNTPRTVTLDDFLTEQEISQAVDLGTHQAVLEQIIEPNIERINEALGQENDARYLAYCVEHVMRSAGLWS